MPPSFAMGEAAGTAAALAVREGVSPRRVPTGWLHATLREHGVYLGEPAPLTGAERRAILLPP